jgi:hypothetical protein
MNKKALTTATEEDTKRQKKEDMLVSKMGLK